MPVVPTKTLNVSRQRVRGTGADLTPVAEGLGNLGAGLEEFQEREDARIVRELKNHTSRMLSDLKTGSTVDDNYWRGLSQRTGIDINKLRQPVAQGGDLWGYESKPGQLFTTDGYTRTRAFTENLTNAYVEMAPAQYKDGLRDIMADNVTRDLSALDVFHEKAQVQAETEMHLAEREGFMNNAISNYLDPVALNDNTIDGLIGISRYGMENGHTRARILSDQQAFHTVIVEGVIDRYLARNDYAGANAYWDSVKDGSTLETEDGARYSIDVAGSAMAKIEAKLATGAAVQTATLKAEGDDILANLDDGIVDPRARDWLDRADAMAPHVKAGSALHNVFDKVKDAVADQPLVEEFNRLPLSQQRQLMDTIAANRITKPKDKRELDRAERQTRLLQKYRAAHDKTQSQIDNGEGLLAASQNIPGVKEKFEPIDWSNPNPAALYNRVRLAETLSSPAYYGQTVAPLTKAEASEIAGVVENMNADQAAGYTAQLADSMGLAFTPAVTGVMVDSGQPEIGIALYHEGSPVSREIFHGLKVKQGLAKGEGAVFKLTATDRRDAVETAFGPDGADVLNQLGEDAGSFISAADAIYYSRAQRSGENDFDQERYEEALKDALGGTFNFNGKETVAPVPGMSQADFEKLALQISNDDLRMFGNGQPMTADGESIDMENITGVDTWAFGGRRRSLDRPYQLVYVGPGRYQFKNSLGFISADGSPTNRFEFDFRQYMQSKGER